MENQKVFDMDTPSYWRKCSVCKKEIKFDRAYQVCTVSTCRKSVYCSVDCFDTHVPLMNHKSAWAEEHRSPTYQQYLQGQNQEEDSPRRVIVEQGDRNFSSSLSKSTNSSVIEEEILIVASKLKSYVKNRSDLNTSASVMEKLSDIVRIISDRAIENAKNEGRKTLMDRDFDFFFKNF